MSQSDGQVLSLPYWLPTLLPRTPLGKKFLLLSQKTFLLTEGEGSREKPPALSSKVDPRPVGL